MEQCIVDAVKAALGHAAHNKRRVEDEIAKAEEQLSTLRLALERHTHESDTFFHFLLTNGVPRAELVKTEQMGLTFNVMAGLDMTKHFPAS